MITELEITELSKIPDHYEYANELEWFRSGAKFTFGPETNIIIGSNGSGKSTLLNLLSEYTLSRTTGQSEIPSGIKASITLLSLFKKSYSLDSDTPPELCDGIKIKCDYLGRVYKLIEDSEKDNDSVCSSVDSLAEFMDNSVSSRGEAVLGSLDYFFSRVFKAVNPVFPLRQLKELSESGNDTYQDISKKLLKYYRDNLVPVSSQSEFRYTLLLDEPDRNLDIDNLDTIYDILKTNRDGIQLITVIHNPILIYKLSKLNDPRIKFIELTPGYLSKIKTVISGL